jgi:hypothetical protein
MKRRSRYFQSMSRIMLLFVFLGFAPSFYLKFLVNDYYFYPDGLPVPHIVHGIFLTVWYVLLVIQTGLIQKSRFEMHQRLGWFSTGWAALVVASTVWVISVFPKRMENLAQQLQSTVEEVEPGLSFLLWLDTFMCLLFVAFLVTAIVNRKQSDIHKRLMLFTGLVFIFAATNRMAGTVGQLTGLNIGMPLGLLILIALTSSILFHDRKAHGKILPISWWCFSLYWLSIALSMAISSTQWGGSVFGL